MYYKYGSEEITYLTKKDEILGLYIKETGMLKRPLEKDLFKSLVQSIIAQQISIKAANTVYNKLEQVLGKITPDVILERSIDEIQKVGTTFRKATYIMDIAKAFHENDEQYMLDDKSDDEIIEVLTSFKGIGTWTAEMILLHTYERSDILSFLDIAIKRGMKKLYQLDEIDLETFNQIKENLSPYGSVAAIYFWHLSKNE